MPVEILVLRVVHVLGGLFWVGSGLFNTFFLMPALREAGPAAAPVMAGLARRRMFVVLPVVALLTILSGVRLLWITSANFSPAYFASARGATFAWGGVAGIVAFVLGIFIVRPAGARVQALAQQLQAAADASARTALEADMARAQRLVAIGFPLTTVMLVVAAVAMAVARYII